MACMDLPSSKNNNIQLGYACVYRHEPLFLVEVNKQLILVNFNLLKLFVWDSGFIVIYLNL